MLTETDFFAFCCLLWRSTQRRWITFVEKVLGQTAVALHDRQSELVPHDDNVLDVGLDIEGFIEDE